jgi:hypothetical protein
MIKGKIVDYWPHKNGKGTQILVSLEDETEVFVYSNRRDFMPLSRKVTLKKEGEFFKLENQFDTIEDKELRMVALAGQFGVSLFGSK